jgi:hypothetical protein
MADFGLNMAAILTALPRLRRNLSGKTGAAPD